MSGRFRRTRGRRRGQALVEFAMFFLILMIMVGGVTDIAGLLNDHTNLEFAARTSARTGAVLGNIGYADCPIIGAAQAALTNMPNLTLKQITIYKADGSNGQPLNSTYEDIYAGNTTCTVSGGVATYTPAPIQVGWPPASRSEVPFLEDSIGVRLDYSYQFEFGLVGSGAFSASDYAVMPISPYAVPSPVITPTPIHGKK